MKMQNLLMTALTVATVGSNLVTAPCCEPKVTAVTAPEVAVSEVTADEVVKQDHAPQITAKAGFLLEANSGKVLFTHNADQHLPIASMTKVATLGVIYDAIAQGKISMDDMVLVSERASSMGGSQAFLDAGSEYSVRDLIQSIVVASANDSCVALAEYVSGSVENFVEEMNSFARSLGCQDTNFVNCTGLPATGAYSCAKDMAKMYQKIMQSPHYGDFNHVWMYDLTHPSGRVTGLTNTNKLIRRYQGCLGGKTGFTNEAGHCITVAAKKGDLQPIAVIIGASNSQTRFNESSALLDYACQNFENRLVVDASKPLQTVKLNNAVSEEVEVYPAYNYYHLTAKNQNDQIALAVEVPATVTAPCSGTAEIGQVLVTDNGKVVAEIPVCTRTNVEKANYWQTVQKIIRRGQL